MLNRCKLLVCSKITGGRVEALISPTAYLLLIQHRVPSALRALGLSGAGGIFLTASRHCEARSNPENKPVRRTHSMCPYKADPVGTHRVRPLDSIPLTPFGRGTREANL